MAKKKEEPEEKNKLQTAIDALNKTYGIGTVLTLDSKVNGEYNVISSGSIGFDWITLGVGGFVKGKMYELMGWESSGKSTVCAHTVANCQKQGGTVLYIDGEHAVDKLYFQAIGVDTQKLLIAQPNSGEEGFNIALSAISTGEVDLIIIDSDSSLLPQKVVDGEVGDSAIGKKALLNSNAYPKLKNGLVANNVCLIVISQYREKIGVMYGCLHGNNLLHFTDGRVLPIKDVVRNKIEGNVYTINDDNEIESRKIIDWHNNGLVHSNADFVHIETSGLDGQNTIAITVTPNHKLLTEKGWVEAIDITVSHKLISQYKSVVNNSLGDFLYGTFAGDCSILNRDKTTANIRFQDKINSDYLKWKIEKLSTVLEFKNRNNVYHSNYTSEFKIIRDTYPKRDPMILFNNYSDLGLAVWFMDDAHFDNKDYHCRYILSIKRFKSDIDKMIEISNEFIKRGIDCKVKKNGKLVFDKENTIKIAELIYKYVPECMQYKLPNEYKNKYEDFILHTNIKYKPYPVNIKTIRFASDKQMKIRTKYDISVEENKNYVAGGVINGVIVHNSPVTTQGGHALKYYSDCRIEISRTLLREGDSVTANITKVKSTKNKMASPFKSTQFNIVYGEGIDYIDEILYLLNELELAKKWGKDITIGEEKMSISDFKQQLREDVDFFNETRQKIIDKIKEVNDL